MNSAVIEWLLGKAKKDLATAKESAMNIARLEAMRMTVFDWQRKVALGEAEQAEKLAIVVRELELELKKATERES